MIHIISFQVKTIKMQDELSLISCVGRSWGGEGLAGSPLLWVKNEEMTEGGKASCALVK